MQKIISPPDMHIHKLKRLLAQRSSYSSGADSSPTRTRVAQQSVGAGDVVGGADSSGEAGEFLQRDHSGSDPPTVV